MEKIEKLKETPLFEKLKSKFGKICGLAVLMIISSSAFPGEANAQKETGDTIKTKFFFDQNDINEESKKHVFIDQDTLPIKELYLIGEKSLFNRRDRFAESIDSALAKGEIDTTNKNLNIMKVNFLDAGYYFAGAIYLPTINTIFLNENSSSGTSEKSEEEEEEYAFLVSKTNISHEFFHYFYDNCLNQEGYLGPPVAEILSTAIINTYKRFGSLNKSRLIGGNIDEYLSGVDIQNEKEILSFCQKLTSKIDIISLKRTSDDLITEEDVIKELKRLKFGEFLDEYLARVYNGVLGNTSSKVKKIFEDSNIPIGERLSDENLNEIYYNPTKEEIELLKSMKWNNKPLI